MSKKGEARKIEDQPEEEISADYKANPENVEKVTAQVSKLTGIPVAKLVDEVQKWMDVCILLPIETHAQRGETEKRAIARAVFVGCCLARLMQIGMNDGALLQLAERTNDIFSARGKYRGDAWLVFASGEGPMALTERVRLIDKVARAKGLGVTILDVGDILRAVEA